MTAAASTQNQALSALLFEYEAAVMRPESGILLPRPVINDVLDYLCSAGQRQQIYFLWRPTLPDPSDDPILLPARTT